MPITRGNVNTIDNRRPYPHEVVEKMDANEIKQYVKDIYKWKNSKDGKIELNCPFYMMCGKMSHVCEIPHTGLGLNRLLEMAIMERAAFLFAKVV